MWGKWNDWCESKQQLPGIPGLVWIKKKKKSLGTDCSLFSVQQRSTLNLLSVGCLGVSIAAWILSVIPRVFWYSCSWMAPQESRKHRGAPGLPAFLPSSCICLPSFFIHLPSWEKGGLGWDLEQLTRLFVSGFTFYPETQLPQGWQWLEGDGFCGSA